MSKTHSVTIETVRDRLIITWETVDKLYQHSTSRAFDVDHLNNYETKWVGLSALIKQMGKVVGFLPVKDLVEVEETHPVIFFIDNHEDGTRVEVVQLKSTWLVRLIDIEADERFPTQLIFMDVDQAIEKATKISKGIA